MAFTHIWHQLYLYRQKVTLAGLLAVALLSGNTASAQQKIQDMNKPGYDDKPVHYGFYLAVPLTRYNLQHSELYASQVAVGHDDAVNAKSSLGFYTGLVLNVRLAEYLDARFVPGVGFYGRTIVFSNIETEVETTASMNETVSNTMIELPLLLKYKAKRRSNFRPYMVAGIKASLDLGKGNNGKTQEEIALEVDDYDLALEYGIGVDIFYPYFKFAPELRFSHGLVNVHEPVAGSIYSGYIQKLTNHNVSLIFFFE